MIFDLIRELEIFLSDIVFTGINNIDYEAIDKINEFIIKFEKLSMEHIKDLLIELSESIKTYKTNENKIENIKTVSSQISKIEFYIRNALFFE